MTEKSKSNTDKSRKAPDKKVNRALEPDVQPSADEELQKEPRKGLHGGDNLEAQALRLGDSRIPAVQRQVLAQNIMRLQGNHHLNNVLANRPANSPGATDLIQRQPLGEAATRPLASITISSPGYVTTESTITGEQELVPEDQRPGRFDGFSERVQGYAQAWRNRDRLCAVIEDGAGRFHTIKTDWPGRGSIEQVQIVPFRNDFTHLWWVNLPRAARGGVVATGPRSWSSRADQAMNWYNVWKTGDVPASFSCPHDGQHGGQSPSLPDVRRCLEAEFVELLSLATDVSRGDIHVVRPGGGSNPQALLNFDMDEDAKARGGITRLPTDRTSPIPESGITFGPLAFNSRSEIQVLGTAVHESVHFGHAELAISWLQQWRSSSTPRPFPDWLRRQRDRRRLTREEYDLIIEETRSGESPATETLAHLEAFMATYHHMPIVTDHYRFEQIAKGARFWAHAGHAINDSSIRRLTSYYGSLDAAHRSDFASYARTMQSTTGGSLHNYFWNRVVSDVLGSL